jgi:iron-sulfur cluster assembly accessory protein
MTTKASANQNKTVIHRHMTIEGILALFPTKAQRLAQEINSAGLHCMGCHAATWETLEVGMLSHGKTEADIERLLKRLNDLLNEEEPEATTISLTKRAAEKFQNILNDEGKHGWALRFGDKMAGCSGFEYILDYSEKALSDDEIFESHGIEIHVNKASAQRLMGSEIDYVDGLHGSGFKISNPHVKTSCGCGSSHSY